MDNLSQKRLPYYTLRNGNYWLPGSQTLWLIQVLVCNNDKQENKPEALKVQYFLGDILRLSMRCVHLESNGAEFLFVCLFEVKMLVNLQV